MSACLSVSLIPSSRLACMEISYFIDWSSDDNDATMLFILSIYVDKWRSLGWSRPIRKKVSGKRCHWLFSFSLFLRLVRCLSRLLFGQAIDQRRSVMMFGDWRSNQLLDFFSSRLMWKRHHPFPNLRQSTSEKRTDENDDFRERILDSAGCTGLLSDLRWIRWSDGICGENSTDCISSWTVQNHSTEGRLVRRTDRLHKQSSFILGVATAVLCQCGWISFYSSHSTHSWIGSGCASKIEILRTSGEIIRIPRNEI